MVSAVAPSVFHFVWTWAFGAEAHADRPRVAAGRQEARDRARDPDEAVLDAIEGAGQRRG